ncbi:MAG: MFS transporter [Acidimicrobiales bacterium]
MTGGDRRALRSVGLQFWVNGMVFASFLPRLPEIRTRIDADLRLVGLLLTLGATGGLLGSAVAERVIRRLGTRTAMTGGATALVAVLPIVGLAATPAVFVAALVALHLADVVTDISMNLQASRLSARRSVPVMNRLHGLWSVGTVVGGVGATMAAGVVSLQAHLVIVSVILGLTVAYVAPGLLTDDDRGVTPPGPAGVAMDGEPAGQDRSNPGGGTPDAGRNPGPRIGAVSFALFGMFAFAVEAVPPEWAAVRMVDDLGVDPGRAGVAYVAVTSGMVVGRFAGDWISTRLGPSLSGWGALVAGVGTAVATLAPGAIVTVAGFALIGLGASVLFPALYDAAARSPHRPEARLGAMTAGIRIISLVLPVTVGALAAHDGVTVGMAMAAVGLPSAVALVVLTRPGRVL